MNQLERKICRLVLFQSYFRQVEDRGTRRISRKSLSNKYVDPVVDSIYEKAGMERFKQVAMLFVKAQFETMPKAWCVEQFKRGYPPYNVVLGDGSWQRYQDYLEKGRRDG